MWRVKRSLKVTLEWLDLRSPSGQLLDSSDSVAYRLYKWCLRHPADCECRESEAYGLNWDGGSRFVESD